MRRFTEKYPIINSSLHMYGINAINVCTQLIKYKRKCCKENDQHYQCSYVGNKWKGGVGKSLLALKCSTYHKRKRFARVLFSF